jgi:hypothetical protein
MGSCYDPLFTVQYPYTHSIVTSTNVRVRLPARYYDGAAAFIIGYGDIATMESWTAGTGYQPVRTESGRGVAALLVLRYFDADLAPYDEAITAFVVNTEDVTIPDTQGAMLTALLDPENRIWSRGLILSEDLPIVVGREYLFIPKEPDPKIMSIDVQRERVSFHFAEPDGTPIAGGNITLDPGTTAGPAGEAAFQAGLQRFALDVVGRGVNWRGRFVFRNIEHPEEVAPLTAVGRFVDPASIFVTGCCSGSSFWFDPETTFGADLAALQLEPRVIFAVAKGMRFVLDAEL